MTGPVVASAAIQLVASTQGFLADAKRKISPDAQRLGQQVSDEISRPIAEKIRASIKAGLSTDGKTRGAETGEEYGDAFSRTVKARIEAAFKTLPTADLKADASDVDRKLAQIRATLLGLNDQAYLELGIDDKTTLATLAALQAELEELTGPEHDIRVRVNAGATAAELAGLQTQLDKLSRSASGGGPGGVGGDLAGIGSGAGRAGSSIYTFLLPALGAAATAVGPFVAVGAAGFGTLLLGAKGLEDEVKTKLRPAFTDLQKSAAAALGPGVSAGVDELAQALPKLTPLINTFGAAVGGEINKFATYLNNGGLQSFSAYAQTELPIVEHLFESATVAGVKFFAALTPLGNGLLKTLTDVATAVGFISDKFGNFESGLQGKVSGSQTPGLAQVGYGLGGGGANGYSKSFSNDPNAKDSGNAFANFTHDVFTFFSSQGSPTGTQNGQKPKAPAVPQFSATAADRPFSNPVPQVAPLSAAAKAYNAVATAATQYATSQAAATTQMQGANDAAGLLEQALNGLGNNYLGLAQSNTAFHSSILSLNQSLVTNGTTLDINSAKGQANRQSIEQAVAAAQAHAEAVGKQTGSTAKQTAAYNADIATLERQVGATGAAKVAIEQYIKQIGKIPPVKRTKLEIDTAAIQAQLNALTARIVVHLQAPTTVGGLDYKGQRITGATGGKLVGAGTGTSDSVPAWLSNGEFVSTAASTARNEMALAAANRGATLIAHYASGGFVAPVNKSGLVHSGTGAGPAGPNVVQVVVEVPLDGRVISRVVKEVDLQDRRG